MAGEDGEMAESRAADPGVDVIEVREVDLDLVGAFARLVPQLSASAPPPGADELAAVLGTAGTTVFAARTDGVVVGLLTLVVFPIPTGTRAWVEDVVVDEAARGRGVGEALLRAALAAAGAAGARTVDLTSRPDRQAANRLYERVGFERRETNVMRFTLEA